MRKVRFATAGVTTKEVDVAFGLGGTVVLATECKVSNDETNSVKRANDIRDKAAAWKAHWGSFVKPGAVLQGVWAFKEIEGLLGFGVEVFWSHDLPRLDTWISENLDLDS